LLLRGGTLGYYTRPYTIPFTNTRLPLSIDPTGISTSLNRLRRTSVYEDNTYTSPRTFLARFINGVTGGSDAEPKKGDYAVPTIFNGNFDAITNTGSPTAGLGNPGWSLYNAGYTTDPAPLQSQLVRNAASDNTSYALMLGGAGNRTTVTHNPFIIPDWGSLRFDLHTGDVPENSSAGTLRVFLRLVDDPAITTPITEIELQEARGLQSSYLLDTRRIGYGETGFETFTVDVPDRFRGRTATLRFEATNGTVYLDNIFFKSQHLLFGNPTEARTPDAGSPQVARNQNNYLLEKPQFAISYSENDNIPNWSAWQLNNSWTGTERRRVAFFGDPMLDRLDWTQVTDQDYERNYGIPYGSPGYVAKADLPQINPQPDVDGNVKPYKLAPGHLASVSHRSRTRKDVTSTFLTTNVVPQFDKLNAPVWEGLENDFERVLVDRSDNRRELYIYSGSVGTKQDKQVIHITDQPDSPYDIRVPEALWRVVVRVDRPGLGVQDITSGNTVAFGLLAANELPSPGQTPFDPWYRNSQIILSSVQDLENYLNADPTNQARGIRYNFLANLPQDIRDLIKNQPFPTLAPGQNPTSAFLLAEPSGVNLVGANTAIWHGGIEKDVIHKAVNFFDSNSSQISTGQITSDEHSSSYISSYQDSIRQIAATKFSTLLRLALSRQTS
jgi:DNA/RNA endonuclease G (NUC1)